MHIKNIEADEARIVRLNYTNYRGETRLYRVIPHAIKFGKNEFHPEEQWLMEATDVDRNVVRVFGMKHIHSWSV